MATDHPSRGSDSDANLGDEDVVRDDELLDDDQGDDIDEGRVRDDDFERDFGAAEPPDPLGQAMPDITEAHVAEAGGPVRRTRAVRRADRAQRAEVTGGGGGSVGGGGDAGGGAVAVGDSGGSHE